MAEQENTGTTAPEDQQQPPQEQPPQDQEQQEEEYQYNVTIEESGPATRKITIVIPQDRITAKLDEQFRELRREAAIPGFRPGHAPRALIEKRFASDVRDQVKRMLISEAYEQAIEKNKLNVLGEPEIADADKITLPDTGDLTLTFTIEVQPEFAIPDLKGLKIKKPRIDVTDQNVDQALDNLREQQGALVPVEDRGVEPKDYMLADVLVRVEGEVVAQQQDAQLVARPGRIGGIQIDDLDTQLAGLKPGETRTFKVTVPDTHANEKIRGKEAEIEVALKDLKKLELAEVNQEFVTNLGFGTEQELREALRVQMIQRLTYDVEEAMRGQVRQFLMENIKFELPAKLSERQTERVINRRYIDLMMRGVSRDQIDVNIERLQHGAADEAATELKLYFILQKLATDLGVDVSEGELNGRIAMLAASRGRRPEKLKQEMAADGTLANLYVTMREQKAIDAVLAGATIEEVDMAAAAEDKKE